MNLRNRNLTADLRGSDVAELHNDLSKLGLPIPESEKKDSKFGTGTLDIVKQFQKDHLLDDTGIVDEDTAKALTRAVEAVTYTVTVGISSEERAGTGNLRLRLVD